MMNKASIPLETKGKVSSKKKVLAGIDEAPLNPSL